MNIFAGDERNGVLGAGAYIFHLKIGIVVANDLAEREFFVEQFQHTLRRDARARYTRRAKVNSRISGDSRYHFHTSLHPMVLPRR